MDEETGNLRRLVRALALFIFVPTLSIGAALAAWDFDAHWMHAGSFLLLSIASVFAWWKAEALARRLSKMLAPKP